MQIKNHLTVGLFLALTMGFAQHALAQDYAAVSKSTCHRMVNSTQPFILVLSKGDNLRESITECAADAKLMAASVSGLGQVHNPTLAYFTSNPEDKPTLTAFPGYYELASLNGNITNNANKYYTHLHVALADENFRGITGHLETTEVGLTVEVTITPLSAPVERSVDSETGFGPIVTQ